MRQKIVGGVLFGLLVAFGAVLAVRPRAPHAGIAPPSPPPTPVASSPSQGSSSAQAQGSSRPPGSPPSPASALPSGSTSPDGGAPPLFDRPLRVAVQGWDLAVPALMANGGLDEQPGSELAKAGLDVKVSVSDDPQAVETALAKGGADKDGADVVVMPLPSLVAAAERLRVLSPEVFFVVGWSHGREAVHGVEALTRPPDKLRVIGPAGAPETFVSLFAAEATGAPASRIIWFHDGTDANIRAQDRASQKPMPIDPEGKATLAFTTADASRLVPYVAVAPHGLLDRSKDALSALARAIMAGQKQVEADPPAAARTVGALPGAPGALPLLRALGEITPSSLADNTRAFGLSGRGAATLETLYQASWRLWRLSGQLSTPAPESAPINTQVVSSLVRNDPALLTPSPPPAFKSDPEKARPLLVYRQPEGKLDEVALSREIGLLAGVFERSSLRVGVKKGGGVDQARTKKVVEAAQGEFDLPQGRVVPAGKAIDKASAWVEVLAAP